MTMTIGSCYAGAIDAFGYAANEINKSSPGALKLKMEWQIELLKQSHIYLNKNHPGTKKFYYDEWFEQYKLQHVDILCGGDPCQPHSNSGNRLGAQDDRFRWPLMYKLIEAVRPNWIINENVIGSISNLVLDQKITDLEKVGYTCQPYIIPAVGVNACHQRKRVFLVANANAHRRREFLHGDYGSFFTQGETTKYALDTCGNAFLQFEKGCGEPALFAVDDGIPDHIFRLGAAGNSIVSPIPIILLTAIYEIQKQL